MFRFASKCPERTGALVYASPVTRFGQGPVSDYATARKEARTSRNDRRSTGGYSYDNESRIFRVTKMLRESVAIAFFLHLFFFLRKLREEM